MLIFYLLKFYANVPHLLFQFGQFGLENAHDFLLGNVVMSPSAAPGLSRIRSLIRARQTVLQVLQNWIFRNFISWAILPDPP